MYISAASFDIILEVCKGKEQTDKVTWSYFSSAVKVREKNIRGYKTQEPTIGLQYAFLHLPFTPC